MFNQQSHWHRYWHWHFTLKLTMSDRLAGLTGWAVWGGIHRGYRGMGNDVVHVQARLLQIPKTKTRCQDLHILRDIEGHVKVDRPTTR